MNPFAEEDILRHFPFFVVIVYTDILLYGISLFYLDHMRRLPENFQHGFFFTHHRSRYVNNRKNAVPISPFFARDKIKQTFYGGAGRHIDKM